MPPYGRPIPSLEVVVNFAHFLGHDESSHGAGSRKYYLPEYAVQGMDIVLGGLPAISAFDL
jgi:hypothetical protein